MDSLASLLMMHQYDDDNNDDDHATSFRNEAVEWANEVGSGAFSGAFALIARSHNRSVMGSDGRLYHPPPMVLTARQWRGVEA